MDVAMLAQKQGNLRDAVIYTLGQIRERLRDITDGDIIEVLQSYEKTLEDGLCGNFDISEQDK